MLVPGCGQLRGSSSSQTHTHTLVLCRILNKRFLSNILSDQAKLMRPSGMLKLLLCILPSSHLTIPPSSHLFLSHSLFTLQLPALLFLFFICMLLPVLFPLQSLHFFVDICDLFFFDILPFFSQTAVDIFCNRRCQADIHIESTHPVYAQIRVHTCPHVFVIGIQYSFFSDLPVSYI